MIVIFVLLLCSFICVMVYYFTRYISYCSVDNSLFPEMEIFKIKTNIALLWTDLQSSLLVTGWLDIKSLDNIDYTNPFFNNDISNNFISFNLAPFNESNVIIYPLVIKKKYFYDNTKFCPSTISAINGIPNVFNAFILCLKDNSKFSFNIDSNVKYRCIIPYVTTVGDSGIKISDTIFNWKDIMVKYGFLMFDPKCDHYIWNNTIAKKYFLVLDLFA